MAVSANALSLADYAIISNEPRVLRITQSLLINGAVLTDIPLYNDKTMLQNGVRWEKNLPSVTWGNLNTEPTVTKGSPTPFQEQAYIVRNAVDVDHFIVEDKNTIQDPRAVQMSGWLQAMSYGFNDYFINNNHVGGDNKSFIGMRERLDDPTKYGTLSEMKIDCGSVEMSISGLTAKTAATFIEYIMQLFTYMGSPNGDGVVLYMNDYMIRRFGTAVRTMGAGAGFTMTVDAYDRTITKFMNAKIVDIGRKADQTTRIISNTETSTGIAGSSTFTSIYAVKYGEEYMTGWEYDSLGNSIKDIGLIGNAGTILRTLIDWAVGLFPQHTRCIGRLYDIKIS
jgi:hypothetical protein